MKGKAADPGEIRRFSDLSLKVLSYAQVQQIDDLLSQVGPFGQVRLIKRKGHLRFVEKVESLDLLEEAQVSLDG